MTKTKNYIVSFHGKNLNNKQKAKLCIGFAKYIEKAKQGKAKVADNG